jgi:pimeloyl-ACP methyl ester carboxylesterase
VGYIVAPVLLAIVVAGVTAQLVLTRRDHRRFPAPGSFVDGLHLRLIGDGSPPVIFEAGIAASSVNWSAVQSAIASMTSTVSYDRRGLGSSAPGTCPFTLEAMTSDLRRVIQGLGLRRPVVIVGHSFGTLIARVYAHRFREDVESLVLVDPVTPDEWSHPSLAARWRLWRASSFAYLAAAAAHVGLVRVGLWGALRRGGGNAGPVLGLSGTVRRIATEVAKLPADTVPLLRARWSEPRFFVTLARQIRSLPACAREAERQPIPEGTRVTVLSSALLPAERLARHRALATEHIVVSKSGHWVHLDRPDVVLDAVRNAVVRARGGDAGTRSRA